jgi:tRNA threonylcarbamoyladenosine dehydratase
VNIESESVTEPQHACDHDHECSAPPAAPPPVTEEYRLLRQFDRMARLTGDEGMKRLQRSSVIVLGLGGVGSFAAESLARSSVGRIVLVDFDEVCVTNTNRQLHALRGNVGRAKTEVMAERLRLVNPRAEIIEKQMPYEAATAEELLGDRLDMVLDATDHLTAKCHLIAECRKRGLPLVSSMGAAARWDPTKIRVADLAATHTDAMAFHIRKILRQKYAFPADGPWGVAAVFSEENAQVPHDLNYDREMGFRCVCPQGENDFLTCERRARIDGSASFVTGAFGLVAAATIVKALAGHPDAFAFPRTLARR